MTKDEVVFFPKTEFYKFVQMKFRKYYEPIEETESVFPDGRININCTCLHSALAHQCGYLIREALKCFNESKTTPRGMDCEQEFMSHAVCMESSKSV